MSTNLVFNIVRSWDEGFERTFLRSRGGHSLLVHWRHVVNAAVIVT